MKSTIHNTAFIGAMVCIALAARPLSAADVVTVLPNGEVRVAGSAPSAPAPGEVTIGGGHVAAAGTVTAGNMVVGRTSQAAGAEAVRGDDARLIPVGTLLPFAGSTAPAGWLLCDGQAVSRTIYAALFSAIGTTWGAGDGSTTFQVPDFSRRTLVGRGGTGTAILGNKVGALGGEEAHKLSVAEMPSHSHMPVVGLQNWPGGGTASGSGSAPQASAYGSTPAGGDAPHNVMQPSAVVIYMIKY